MTSTPASGQQAGNMRVSDAERDTVVSQLSEHFQAGRLTTEEFDERSGLALGARTRSDLTSLMTDLPGAAALASPAVSPTLTSGQGGQALSARWTRVWVLLGVIAVLSTVTSLVGHGPDGHVPWGLILIGLLIFRRYYRGTRRARR